MNKRSVEREIRGEKEELKRLRAYFVQHAEQQETLLQDYTLKKKNLQKKARQAATQNITLHVLSFLAALSWGKVITMTIDGVYHKKSTPWCMYTVVAMSVTVATVGLASRWAVASNLS